MLYRYAPLLLMLALVSVLVITVANAVEIVVTPEHPKIGDVITITIKDKPNTELDVSVVLYGEIKVSGSTTCISAEDVPVPSSDNDVTISAENVDQLCVSVKFLFGWVTRCSSSGVLSAKNIPAGKYDVKICVTPKPGVSKVPVKLSVSTRIKTGSDGTFSVSYDTDNLPLRWMEITCDGVTKRVGFSTTSSAPSGGGGGAIISGGGEEKQKQREKETTPQTSLRFVIIDVVPPVVYVYVEATRDSQPLVSMPIIACIAGMCAINKTDALGIARFRFVILRPGVYTVIACLEQACISTSIQVSEPKVYKVLLKLLDNTTVLVRVLGYDNIPLPNKTVVLYVNDTPVARGVTDENGSAVFKLRLPLVNRSGVFTFVLYAVSDNVQSNFSLLTVKLEAKQSEQQNVTVIAVAVKPLNKTVNNTGAVSATRTSGMTLAQALLIAAVCSLVAAMSIVVYYVLSGGKKW